MCPVTTRIGRAFDDKTLSTTRATIVLPDGSVTSSLLYGAIRVDLPAAITTAAIVGALRGAAPNRGVAGAFSRGRGRLSNSFNNPPTPMRMISALVTFNPANNR